jgi:hypothetical protein
MPPCLLPPIRMPHYRLGTQQDYDHYPTATIWRSIAPDRRYGSATRHGILAPCPRREDWARILSTGSTDMNLFEEEVRALTGPDKRWV